MQLLNGLIFLSKNYSIELFKIDDLKNSQKKMLFNTIKNTNDNSDNTIQFIFHENNGTYIMICLLRI